MVVKIREEEEQVAEVSAVAAVETAEQPVPDKPEKRESMLQWSCWDIETGQGPEEELRKLMPEFVPPPHPGEFDASSVKLGNLKDPAKIREKIESARAAHEAAVTGYVEQVEAARQQQYQDFADGAALDATTGRVVAIGVCSGHSVWIFGDTDDDPDEVDIIAEFWDFTNQQIRDSCPMLGFNIHSFDLPFLVRRSWILGVPVPSGVRQGRYWNSLFVDVMREWGFHAPQERIKLDLIGKVFGLGGKTEDVEGKDFHKLWLSDRTKAVEYLTRDVELTAKVAAAMGLIS